jgi:hypothetical protein
MIVKKILISMFFLFLMTTVCYSAPNYSISKPQQYVQNSMVQNGKSDAVMLVIDYSSSMSSWVKLAEQTLKNILPQIPPNTSVGLRVFGGTSVSSDKLVSNTLLESFMRFGASQLNSCRNTYVVAKPASAGALYSEISKISTGGATPLTLALKESVSKDFAGLNAQKKKIVLITDGDDTCGGNPCSAVKSIAASDPNLQIDVILIGSKQLRCLSDATNGTHFNVSQAEEFNTALGVAFETLPYSQFEKITSPKTQNIRQNNEIHYEFMP